jgi:predicted glycosyltransferase involved in capsule biosynthesis
MKIFTKIKTTFENFIKEKLFNQNKQMAFKKNLENLSDEQEKFGSRIFNLLIGRVLKTAYLTLDEKGKENMKKIFSSDSDKEKKDFIEKYIPNFKEIFEEEAKKIEEEIKAETEKLV